MALCLCVWQWFCYNWYFVASLCFHHLVILSSVRPCGMLQFYSIFSMFFLYLPFFWFVHCYMCWYFSVSLWIVCNFIAGLTKYPLNSAKSLHFFIICEIYEFRYLWKSQFCRIIYFMERERVTYSLSLEKLFSWWYLCENAGLEIFL